ncbi:MAG: ATP-binding protein [Betaproteobacteria bacterium]
MNRPAAPGSHSLRRRLLVSVMAAILIGAVFQGASAYRSALAQADTLFDYHLQQMANSLRGGPALPGLQLDNTQDDSAGYVIQIWSADGTHVFQSSRVVLPARAVLGFTDVTHQGTRYRVYSVQTPLQTIQIAQNMDDRLSRARALAARALLPMAIVAPLLMLALWWIINRSLAPLERTRQQVAARAADDLTALPESGLPEEVQPLVQEINLLFGRLHDSFDAQRAFVANAAHELRSPLTALKLQAQSLARTSDPQAQQQAATRLNQGVDRAIALMQQLLVLARQESAHPSPGMHRRIDLQALSETIVRDLQPQAQASAITLTLSAGEPTWVDGDTDGLSILLRNLLENAIKYTPREGHVVLQVDTREGQPVLAVEDSGPGIPSEQRERLFERFVRGEHQDASGSGLGLSIARAIAKRHGARLVLAQSRDLAGLSAQVIFPGRTTQ